MSQVEEDVEDRKVSQANPHPCAACPWRTENHGKRHAEGWYTEKNRRRLWSKLRRGDSMTCHPTDPRMGSESETTHECAGGLVLQQREVKKFEAACLASKNTGLKDYLRSNPGGMTKVGLLRVVERAFSGLFGRRSMPALDLNEPVSHPGLEWPL